MADDMEYGEPGMIPEGPFPDKPCVEVPVPPDEIEASPASVNLGPALEQLAKNIGQLDAAIVKLSGSYRYYDRVMKDYRESYDRLTKLYEDTLAVAQGRVVIKISTLAELQELKAKWDNLLEEFNRHVNATTATPGPPTVPCHSGCETVHNVECPNGTPMKHQAERPDADGIPHPRDEE